MHWQKNYQIIQKRWPSFAQALDSAQIGDNIEYFDQGPEPTLLIDDLQLTSCYNRAKEARLHLNLLPPGTEEIVFYGFALGDTLHQTIEQGSMLKISVMPLNLSLSKASLYFFDQQEWLRDPRVEFITEAPSEPTNKPFITNPIELRLSDDSHVVLRDKLTLHILESHSKEKMLEREPHMQRNILANHSIIADDGDVRQLFDTHQQGVSVVVGAGPTLSMQFSLLHKIRSNTQVICVSRALKPLLDEGITPNVIIAIDPEDSVQTHFQDLPVQKLQNIPLVYLPCVNPNVLRGWPGPRLTTYVEHQRYIETMRTFPKGTLFTSGTVVHSAVDLAVRMGSNKVIMMGIDFALPGGKSHAENVANAEKTATKSNYTLIDGHGQRVPTNTPFIIYLRDLENYIEKRPDVTFLNTGRTGAMIKGTKWLEETND